MRVIEFFDRGVQVNPDGIAFMAADGSATVTYRESQALTHRVAAALQRDGMSAGAPVAVLSGNTPTVLAYVLGVMRAGCAWVALNAKSPPTELAALLNLVGARGLLYSTELTGVAAPAGATGATGATGPGGVVEQILAAVPTIEFTAPIDGADADRWLAPQGSQVELPALDPEEVGAFFGTGGTTGRAKAVGLPHRSLETMIHGFNAHMPERHPVNLVAAPLTHAAGAAVFPVLSLGGTNVIHAAVSPGEILDSIERHRISRLFLPPTAIYALLAHPEVRQRDYSSLRYFLYGAAPMSVAKLKEAMAVFGPVLTQFYGQVELPMLCTFFSPQEHAEALADPTRHGRLASCGRPSLVANVAIMDDDARLLPRGERGEIVVRSSLRMTGYHADPEQTRAVERPGGWRATGDVGYVDDDGFVYIVDRKRDLIISGGFNVFPSEVEQVIWGHPAVRDCAVIGLPDEKWGERVTAVVELANGATVDPQELIALCRERLGGVKAPKEVLFRDLPRSSVGKVLKRALRDEYWAGRDRRV